MSAVFQWFGFAVFECGFGLYRFCVGFKPSKTYSEVFYVHRYDFFNRDVHVKIYDCMTWCQLVSSHLEAVILSFLMLFT